MDTVNMKYIDCNLLQVPTISTELLAGKKLSLLWSPRPRSLIPYLLYSSAHTRSPGDQEHNSASSPSRVSTDILVWVFQV